jgi:hypothetical protein
MAFGSTLGAAFGVGQPEVDTGAFNYPGASGFQQQAASGYTGARSNYGTAFGQQQEARGQSQEALSMLQAQAAGTAPSAAQLQMQSGLSQALRNQNALAASQVSMNPALAYRTAAEQGRLLQTDTLQQMAALRADEQARAQLAFAQGTQGQRSQDLQAQEMAQGLMQYYLSTGMSIAEAQMQAQMQLEAMRQGQFATKAQAGAAILGGAATGAAIALGR